MKLNNKGFAISTIMYMILIMAVILITLTLTLLSSRKLILDKTRKETTDNIYNVYDLSYRQVLEILKEEAIEYANENGIQKDSIKIENLNSSVEKEMLDGYKLSEKYLTMVSNDNLYDVYLGKPSIVTSNNKINNLIDIVDYTISGNTYQETKISKNIFNVDRFVKWQEKNNTATEGAAYEFVELEGEKVLKLAGYGLDSSNYFPVQCDNKTQYTFSLKYKGSGETWLETTSPIFSIEFVYSDGTTTISSSPLKILNSESWTTASYVTEKNKTLVGIYTYAYNETYGYLKEIQLEKGTKATTYEEYIIIPSPQNPSEVLGVGDYNETTGKYEIPIKVSGKNLFDYTQIKETSTIKQVENGIKLSGYATSVGIKPSKFLEMTGLKEGDTITVSRKIETINGEIDNGCSMGAITFLSKNSNVKSFNLISYNKQSATIVIPPNFIDDNFYGLYFYGPCSNASYEAVFTDIQIEKGEQATEYEKYQGLNVTNITLDNVLMNVSESDYINFSTQKLYKKNNLENLSGMRFDVQNTPVLSGKYYRNGYLAPTTMKSGVAIKGYCNVLLANAGDWASPKHENLRFGQVNRMLYVYTRQVFETKELLINYLSNNGNTTPYAVYQLATPQEIDVTLPKISSNFDINGIINIDTNILPSSYEFTVIQKIKQL